MVDVQQLRIVIADDSDVLRQHLSGMLSPLKYVDVVAEADTADRALDAVENLDPDVVVLDIEMPGGGIRALKEIKRQHPGTHVVMLTNHAGSFYRRVCLGAGADFFIDKAMEFEQISTVLASIARS